MDKMNSWKLVDAQQLSDEYPYTFYKPSSVVVSQLIPGNQVKLIFEFSSDDPEAPNAERMWVSITKINGGQFFGNLDNYPAYIQDLKFGDEVCFDVRHIIDTDLNDPVPSITEKYIKKCFVSSRILDDGEKVGYFYREEPDSDDDSGWRFVAGDESEEYMDNPDNIHIVSLGALLRADDSVVDFLELPVGTCLEADDGGGFVDVS